MKTAAHIALCTLAGLLGYQIRQLFSITGKGRCEHRWALPSSLTAQIGWSTAPSPDAPSQEPASDGFHKGSFLERARHVSLQVPKPFHCDPFDHVLAINLEDARGQGRREHMMREFEKAGIKKYNFFPAVDYKKDSQLKRELELIPGLCQNPGRCHNTLGCAMSHRRVYEKIVAEKWPCAMVFEDDAGLSNNFSGRLAEMASGGMPPFDIIFTGWCHGTKESKMTPAKDQTSVPELLNGWPGMCIHAYIVSIYGALMMSQANTPIAITPDAVIFLGKHQKNRTRTHIDPRAVLKGSIWFTSTLMAWQDAGADGLGSGV